MAKIDFKKLVNKLAAYHGLMVEKCNDPKNMLTLVDKRYRNVIFCGDLATKRKSMWEMFIYEYLSFKDVELRQIQENWKEHLESDVLEFAGTAQEMIRFYGSVIKASSPQELELKLEVLGAGESNKS